MNIFKLVIALTIITLVEASFQSVMAQETEVINLKEGWKFHKGEAESAYQSDFNDSKWQSVEVPHDWAIYGPFDKEVDKQVVKIVQNNEKIASEKTGRTGALPFVGVGWCIFVRQIFLRSRHPKTNHGGRDICTPPEF